MKVVFRMMSLMQYTYNLLYMNNINEKNEVILIKDYKNNIYNIQMRHFLGRSFLEIFFFVIFLV